MGAFSTRHGFQVDRDDVLLLFRWNRCQVMRLPILQFLFEIIQNSCVIVHISAEANSVECDRCLIKIHIWALELSWYFSTVVIINMAELNIVNNKKQILINYDNYFLMNFIQKNSQSLFLEIMFKIMQSLQNQENTYNKLFCQIIMILNWKI